MDKFKGSRCGTIFLDLKEILVCFPIWHASHKLSFENLILGRPTTRSFAITLFSKSKLTCANRLCQSHESSLMETRHLALVKDTSFKSSMYTLFTLYPLSTSFFLSLCLIMQQSFENDTLYPLSHNWLILMRLCLRPSTKRTSEIVVNEGLPTLPFPSISPLLLSP